MIQQIAEHREAQRMIAVYRHELGKLRQTLIKAWKTTLGDMLSNEGLRKEVELAFPAIRLYLKWIKNINNNVLCCNKFNI